MKGAIRSVLAVALLAAVWSCLWFEEDGVSFFVPHVGGYFLSYSGE